MSKFPGLFTNPYSFLERQRRVCPPNAFFVGENGTLTAFPSGGKSHQSLSGCVRNVNVALGPTGLIVSESTDKIIRVWMMIGRPQLRKMEGHTSRIGSTALSPDGQLIVSGSDDRTVRIWSVTTGKQLHVLTGHSGFVDSVAFSPDGQLIVSGSEDKTVRIWSVATGKQLQKIDGHDAWVRSVAFSPDGQLIASGSYDNTARIWSVATGQQLHVLTGHNTWLSSIAFSLDGQLLISSGRDHTIRVWSVATGQQLRMIRESNKFTFTPDGRSIISISDRAHIYNLYTGQQIELPCAPNIMFKYSGDVIIDHFKILIDNISNFELALTLRWPCPHLYDPRVWRDVARFV